MKKAVAVLLAFCMVFAMSTVAFAATETIKKDGAVIAKEDAKTIITVYGTSDDDEYTVTIPADIDIEWGDMSEKTMTARIDGQLAKESTVTVSVAMPEYLLCTDPDVQKAYDDGTGEYVMQTARLPIQVSAAGETSGTLTSDQISTSFDTIFHVPSYYTMVIAEYQGTAVYTVDYAPGA